VSPISRLTLILFLVLALPAVSHAASADDPLVGTALALAIVLTAAKLFGHLAEMAGQPAVLGELLAGIVLGVVGRTVFPPLDLAARSPEISLLAGLGVLLLLFEVGLESTIQQMLQLGWPAFRVAVTGVVAPTFLGMGVAAVMIPEASNYTNVFIGATLCATSVGITARVLKDLGRSQTIEARIILGAAVLDDVLGLIVLAVVVGSISAVGAGGSLALSSVLWIALKAVAFLGGALWIGARVAPFLFKGASRLRSGGALLAAGLGFCFVLSWLAAKFGLAPIVGAFAAGLILEEVHYQEFLDRGEQGLQGLVHPIAGFLAPVFFVQMGMLTDVGALLDFRVAGLGLALTVVGVLGKAVAGYAVSAKDGSVDRLAVGLGMIPRGEVGLIFANVGLGLTLFGQPVIDARSYAALVMMVILTTLVTPPALKWRFGSRTDSGRQA
jgi:Kef-type K+ transport system membrane component KefB